MRHTENYSPTRMGELLAKARLEAKLSQREASLLLDVNKKTIQNWESGYTLPTCAELIDIFELYQVNAHNYLMQYKYPSSVHKKATNNRLIVSERISTMSDAEINSIEALTSGRYVPSYPYMQLCLANLKTPMRDRQLVAHIVLNNYYLCDKTDTLRFSELNPDIDALMLATEKGTTAVIHNRDTYN